MINKKSVDKICHKSISTFYMKYINQTFIREVCKLYIIILKLFGFMFGPADNIWMQCFRALEESV